MKGCIHDYTLMEDACDCIRPHTNTADSGMPHTSLIQYIAQLERERDVHRRELVVTLKERDLFAEQARILQAAS